MMAPKTKMVKTAAIGQSRRVGNCSGEHRGQCPGRVGGVMDRWIVAL